ncbi:MAG: hypothetical protein C0405_09865 [Desulfovibrio sp.]|nr:hypothetical protein [Desulfovibrio sp.]
MAVDFRTLLKENMRIQETGERWFEDLNINEVFYLSIQASSLHASTPSALLEDVKDYEAFQVTLQTKQGVFICGKKGAWEHLEPFEWLSLFQVDTPIIREAENVPTAVVQRIYEDVVACTSAHPEMLIKKGLTVM